MVRDAMKARSRAGATTASGDCATGAIDPASALMLVEDDGILRVMRLLERKRFRRMLREISAV